LKRALVLLTVVVVTLLSISCLVSCAAPEAEEPVVLRLAGSHPPMDPTAIGMNAMAERFNERAGGKYIIEVHHAEELIKVNESLDAVRRGVVEMCFWPVGLFGGVDIRFSSAEMPFLYNNVYAHSAAQEPLLPLYSEILEKNFNQKALGSNCAGGFQVGGNKPVKTLEDWDGLLVQAPSPSIADVVDILGGSPVHVSAFEVYDALQKGVVDASLIATTGWLQVKLYEVASHLTLVYLLPANVMMSINLDVWNSLPKNIQDILLEEGQQAGREIDNAMIKAEEETPVKLAECGMEIYTLDKAERDRWQELLRPYNEKLIADMGEFGQKLTQVVDKVNSEHPY
jgi:TRAP-type C4-dicarboxylate transport system substrate-binding protein